MYHLSNNGQHQLSTEANEEMNCLLSSNASTRNHSEVNLFVEQAAAYNINSAVNGNLMYCNQPSISGYECEELTTVQNISQSTAFDLNPVVHGYFSKVEEKELLSYLKVTEEDNTVLVEDLNEEEKHLILDEVKMGTPIFKEGFLPAMGHDEVSSILQSNFQGTSSNNYASPLLGNELAVASFTSAASSDLDNYSNRRKRKAKYSPEVKKAHPKMNYYFIFGKFVKLADRVKKGAIGKIWKEVSDEDKLQFSRIAVDVNLDYREIEYHEEKVRKDRFLEILKTNQNFSQLLKIAEKSIDKYALKRKNECPTTSSKETKRRRIQPAEENLDVASKASSSQKEKESEQAEGKVNQAADNQTVAQTKVDDVIQRTGVPQSGAVQEQDVARVANAQQQQADSGAVVEARARTQTSGSSIQNIITMHQQVMNRMMDLHQQFINKLNQ